jgi:hypothetical protein
MIPLYHGSFLAVQKPDISYSRGNTDFGKGFYTTPLREQAAKWAERFKPKFGQSVVSVYEFDETILKTTPFLEFASYSEEWLDYIFSCRRGENIDEYEIIIGGVANDKVFNTLELYFKHYIEKGEAIKRLKYEKPNSQYCFRSQNILDEYLKFVSSEVLL